jgi:hypothetical protein
MSKRFDLVELVLVAAIAAVTGLGLALYLRPTEPAAWAEDTGAGYVQRFGKAQFSTGVEELLARDFFNDQRDGVFVDVGAGHYRDASNTYYLESVLGWSGLAIDAQAEYESDYATHRPRTQFFSSFVSSGDGGQADLFVPSTDLQIASAERHNVEETDTVAEVRQVPTASLTTILVAAGITTIDYLSIDIELHEPEALAGFDIRRFKPRLVCVESHLEVRQQILDYFFQHGYVVVGKYLRADKNNLYFMPASAPTRR